MLGWGVFPKGGHLLRGVFVLVLTLWPQSGASFLTSEAGAAVSIISGPARCLANARVLLINATCFHPCLSPAGGCSDRGRVEAHRLATCSLQKASTGQSWGCGMASIPRASGIW